MTLSEHSAENDLPRDGAPFVARASRILGGSLSVRKTLLSALRILIPELASWAQIIQFGEHSMSVIAAFAGGSTTPELISVELPDPADEPHTFRDRARAEPLTPTEVPAALIPDDAARAALHERGPAEGLLVPLTARGVNFGAILLARDEPFDDADTLLAEDLGGRIALTLGAARLYEERAHVAAVLQHSLRPPTLPKIEGLQLASRYRSAVEHLEIGGDFFDVHGADGDWLAVIGDVCGKSVEAAVLTGRSRHTIRALAHLERSPARILSVLNDVLYEHDSERFVTAICARLRPQADGDVLVEVANAGHPAPLLLRASGEVSALEVDGVLSGVLAEASYTEVSVRLRPRDTLLLYTDGIYEARGPSGFYGMNTLAELAGRYPGVAPSALCDAIEESVMEHLAGESHDDMALLAISCAAPP